MANVKVAVRVRPLSSREAASGGRMVIDLHEDTISITNIKMNDEDEVDHRERVRYFSFDYTYWSVDPSHPRHALQHMIYAELGTEVIDAAVEGYNACVLAYGQSGSGKTYTIMGTQEEPGLAPRVCEGLLARLRQLHHQGGLLEYSLTLSLVEIYKERVRDLLATGSAATRSLRVREHPRTGPYVEGVTRHAVREAAEAWALLERGRSSRSVAPTATHGESSRSHALLTLALTQSRTATHSTLTLVDLAGSERASQERDRARLAEGSNINKSLVTLGTVISALAERGNAEAFSPSGSSLSLVSGLSGGSPPSGGASGIHPGPPSSSHHSGPPRRQHGQHHHNSSHQQGHQGRLPFIPYRDSVLTWLLRDTLGGNAKTIMIATVSPSSTCFTESLGTLRYAARTRNIVNRPVVNEDPSAATIRSLRQEVSRLTKLLQYTTKSGSLRVDGGTSLLDLICDAQCRAAQLTHDWVNRWHGGGAGAGGSHLATDRWRGSGHLPPEGDGEEEDRVSGALCTSGRQLSASTGQLCSAPVWIRHSCSSLSSLEAIHSGAGLTTRRSAGGSGEGRSCGSEVLTLDPSPRREWKGGRGFGGEGLCVPGERKVSPRREYKGASVGVPPAGGTSATTAAGGCRRQLVVDTQYPYLLNTPHDLQADAIVIHHLQTAETVLGSGGGDEGVTVTLRGPHVSPRHCSLFTSRGTAFLSAYADGEVSVNGAQVPVGSSVRLHEGDLLALGSRRFTFHEATRPLPKPPPLASVKGTPGSEFLMSSVSSSASSSDPMTTSFVSSEVSSSCQDGGVHGGDEVPVRLLASSSTSSSGVRCPTPTSSASSTYNVSVSITTTAAAQDAFHPHVTAATTTNTSISTATAAASSAHLTSSSSTSSSISQGHKRGVASSGEYRQCPKRRRGGGDVKAGPASRTAEPPRGTCGNIRSSNTHGVNHSGNRAGIRSQPGQPLASHKRAAQQPIKCSCCPHSHVCPSCLNNNNNNNSQDTADQRECPPNGSRGHLRREGHVAGAPRPAMEGTKKIMKKLSASSVQTKQLRNLWDSVKKSSSDSEYEDVEDLEVEELMSPLAERTSPIGASHSEGNNSQSRGPDMTDQEDEDEEEEEEDPQPGSCLFHRRQDYGSDTSLDSLGSQHSKASLDSRMYRVSGNSNTYKSSRTFFLDLTGDGERRSCVSELCSPSESSPMAMPQSPTETRKRWDKTVWPEIEKGLRRNFSVPDMGHDDKGSRRRKRSPSPKQNSLDDKEKRQEIIDAVTRRLYPGSGPGFAKKEKKVPDKPKPQRDRLCRCRKKSQSESDSGSNTTPRVPKKSPSDKSSSNTAATTTATTSITTTTSKSNTAASITTSSTSSSVATSSSSSKIPSDIVSRVPFVRRSSLEAPPGSHIPIPIPYPLRPERDRSPSAAEPEPASHSAKQLRSATKRDTKVSVMSPETTASIKTIKPETRSSNKSKTRQKATSQDYPGDAVVSKDLPDATLAEPRGKRVLVPIQPNPDLLSDVAEADMMFSQYESENGSEKRKIPLTKNLEALQKRLTSLSENSEQFSDDSLELQTPDEDAGDAVEPMNLMRRPSDDVFTTSNISTLSKDSLEESTGLDSDIKENVLNPTNSLAPELCNLGRGMPRSPGFSDLHALTAAAQSPPNPSNGVTPKLKVDPYESLQPERAKPETYDSFLPLRAPKLSDRHDSFIQSFFRSISHTDRSDTNLEIEEEELSSDEVSSALVTPKFATPAHSTPTANRSIDESPKHVIQDVANANVSGPLSDSAKYQPYHRPQPTKQLSSSSSPTPQQPQLQPPDAATLSPMTARRLIRERAERRILDTSSSEDSDPESRRRTRRRRKHRKTTPPLVSIPTLDAIEMQDHSEESDDYLSVLQSSPEKREGAKQEDDARNNNTNLNANTVLDNAQNLAQFEQVSRSVVSNKSNNKSNRKDSLTKEARRETFQRMGHVEAYSVLTNIQYSSVENPLTPVMDTPQLLQKTATRLRPYSPTTPLTPQNTLEASLSIDEPQFLLGGDTRSRSKDETAYNLLPPSKPTGTDMKENSTTKLLFASSEKLHRFTDENQEGSKPLEPHSPTRSVSRATDLEEDYETAVGEETPWHESSSESRASFRTIDETSTSTVDSEGTTTPVNTESSPDKKQRQKLNNGTNGVPSFDVTQHGTDKILRQRAAEKVQSQQNDQFFVPTSRKHTSPSLGVTRDINDNNGGLGVETHWDPKRPLETLTIESTDSGGGSPAPASPNSEGFSTETSWEEMVLEDVNANQQEGGKCEDSKSMSQYTPSTARRLLYTIVECSESSRSEGACSEPDLIPDDWRDSTSEIEGGDDGASADGHLSYNGSEDRLSSSDDTLLDTVRHGEDPQPDSLSGIPDDIYEGKALAGANRGLARSYALTLEEGNVTGDSLEHLPTASPSPENGAKSMKFPQTNNEDSLLTTSTALTQTTDDSKLNSDDAGLDAAVTQKIGDSQEAHVYPFTPQNSFVEGFGTENQDSVIDPDKLGISLRTEFPPPVPRNSVCYENFNDNQNSAVDPDKLGIFLRTEFPPPTPRNSICYENYEDNQNSDVDPNKLGMFLRIEFPPPAPRNSICYENYDDAMNNRNINLTDGLTDLMELRGKEDSGQESGNISLAEEAYEISDVEETREESCRTFLESLEKSFVQNHSVLGENDSDLADLVSRSSGDRAPFNQVVISDSAAPVVITSTQPSTPSTFSEEHSAKPFASATNSSGPSCAKPVDALSSLSCPVPRATSDQDDLNEEKLDRRNRERKKTDKEKPVFVNKERTDEESGGGKCEERGIGDGSDVGLDERGKIVKREGMERKSLTQSGRETPLPRHDESQPPASDKRTETSEASLSKVTTTSSSSTSSSSSLSSSSSFSVVKKSFSFGMSIAKLSGKKSKNPDVEVSLQDNLPTEPLPKGNGELEEELMRRRLEADMSRYLHTKLKQLEEDSDVAHDRQETPDEADVGDDVKKQNSAHVKESLLEKIVEEPKKGLAGTCTNASGQDNSRFKSKITSQEASFHTKDDLIEEKNSPKENEPQRESNSSINEGAISKKFTRKDSAGLVQELTKDNTPSSSQDKKTLSSQRLQSLQEMVESIRNSEDYDNWHMRRPHSLELKHTTMPNQEVRQLQPFKDSQGKDIPAKDLHELIRRNSLPSKKGSLDIDHLLPDLRSSLMTPSPMEEHTAESRRKPPPRPPAANLDNDSKIAPEGIIDSKIAPEVKVFPCSPAVEATLVKTDQNSNGTVNKKEPKLFLPLKPNDLDPANGNGQSGGLRTKEPSHTRHVEKLTSDSWHGHFIMEHDRSDHWTTSDESITFIFMSPSEEKEAEPPKESQEQQKQVENAYRSSSDLSNIGLSAGVPNEHRKPQYDLYKASHTRGRLERSASVDSIYIALHKFEQIKIKQEIQRTSSLENVITDELEDIIEKGRLFDTNDSKDDDDDDDTPIVLSPAQENRSLTRDVSLDLTEYKEAVIKRAEYEYMKDIVSSSDDDVFSSHITPTMTFGQKTWWDFENLVMGRPPKITVKTSADESSKSSPQLHKRRRDFSLNKKSVSWTDLDGCGALEVEVPDWTGMQDLVVPTTKPKSIMKKPSLEPITSGSTPTPPTPPQEEAFTAQQRQPLPTERPLPPPVPPRPVINNVVDAKNESSSDSDIPLPRSNLKETFRLQLPEHIRERVRKSSGTSSGSSSSSSSSSSNSSGTSSTSSNSSTEEDASPAKKGRVPSYADKALLPLKEPHSAPATPSTSFNSNSTTTLASSSRRKSEGDLCGGVAPEDVHGASQTWMALSKVMMEAGTILRTLSETSLVLHEQLVSPVVQGRRVSLPILPEENLDIKKPIEMTPLLRTLVPKELVSVGIQTETVENNAKRETRSVLAQTSLDVPLISGASPYQRPSYIANVIDKNDTSNGKTLTVDNRLEADRNLAQQQDSENANDTGRVELTDNRREDINANVAQSHLVPNLPSPLAGGGGILDELNLLRNERERLNRLINKYERSSLLLTRQSYNLNLRNNNITPIETTTPPAPPSSVSPAKNVTENVQSAYEAGNERPPYYKYLSSTSQKYLSLYQKRLEESCQRLEERLEINAKKRQLRSQLLSNKHSHQSLTSLSGTESPSKLSSTEVKNWSIHGSLDLAHQAFGGGSLRLGTGTASSSSLSLPTMSHCSPSRNLKEPMSSPCCCVSPSHRHHQHTLCSSPALTSPYSHSSAPCHHLPSHLSDSQMASSSTTTTQLSTQQCRQQLLQLRRKLINASSSMTSSSSSVANSPSSSRPYGSSSISTSGAGGVEVGMDIASLTSLRGPYRRSHAASLGELPGGGGALGQMSWSRGLRGSSASVASDTEAYHRLRPQLSLDSDSDSGAFSASGLNLRHTRSNHTFL